MLEFRIMQEKLEKDLNFFFVPQQKNAMSKIKYLLTLLLLNHSEKYFDLRI
jgi:hypothetical protein